MLTIEVSNACLTPPFDKKNRGKSSNFHHFWKPFSVCCMDSDPDTMPENNDGLLIILIVPKLNIHKNMKRACRMCCWYKCSALCQRFFIFCFIPYWCSKPAKVWGNRASHGNSLDLRLVSPEVRMGAGSNFAWPQGKMLILFRKFGTLENIEFL